MLLETFFENKPSKFQANWWKLSCWGVSEYKQIYTHLELHPQLPTNKHLDILPSNLVNAILLTHVLVNIFFGITTLKCILRYSTFNVHIRVWKVKQNVQLVKQCYLTFFLISKTVHLEPQESLDFLIQQNICRLGIFWCGPVWLNLFVKSTRKEFWRETVTNHTKHPTVKKWTTKTSFLLVSTHKNSASIVGEEN